jgi:16S rRNA (cytidine1402-2'-O)-methyltransferase
VLVATPIGNLGDLAPRAVLALQGASLIACEDTRHTRKLLNHAGIAGVPVVAVHEHNEHEQAPKLVARMLGGDRIALVTDAGTPAVSDPGHRLTVAAIAAGIRVDVVPGPSAAIAALVVSGLPPDRFVFEGFLPRKGRDRADRLAALADESRTVVLYEAPHRLATTIKDLASACGGARRVALCRELTKLHEEVWRGDLASAVEHVAAVAPRGEYVIVVEGAAEGVARPTAETDVLAALAARLAAGDTRRDAVDAVAADLRLSRRAVYQIALNQPPSP